MNLQLYLILLFPLTLAAGLLKAQLPRSSTQSNFTTTTTYSVHFIDAFSFTNNQAALAQTKTARVAVYSEKRFMLKELRAFSAAISVPSFQHGAAGISCDYTGLRDYNQSRIGLAYGMSLGSKVDLGVQFNYHRISIARYGAASAISFELGTLWHLTEKINAGLHLYNPVGGKFGQDRSEKIRSVYSFGLGYEASEKFYIGTQLVKEEDRQPAVNIALHYSFAAQFFARVGLSSGTGSYFLGAGLTWKNTRIDLIADRHPQTGLTPALVLNFPLSKPKQGKQ